jgi:ADP-ribose pyrophosphatase
MNETTLRETRVFDGRLLKVDVLDVRLEDGRTSVREVVRHPGAVAVLVRRPDGRFALVRQFRKAIESDLLEVVAGGLEPGESPDACAAREVREETGCSVTSLKPLGHVYSAPGFCSERLHLFYAETAPGAAGLQPDADEELDVVLLKESDLDGLVRQGAIHDAKTLACWALYRAGAAGTKGDGA